MTRRGLPRPQPGTFTCASVLSASVTSAGEALASCVPNGMPWPSTNTIRFVPLPRLVLPTPAPPFSPIRSCSPGKSHPSPAVRGGSARPATHPRLAATRLAPPTAANAASRSAHSDTPAAGPATAPRSSAATEFLPCTPGSKPKAVPAHLICASVGERNTRSTPTAGRSATWLQLSPFRLLWEGVSPESEPIYETSSSH